MSTGVAPQGRSGHLAVAAITLVALLGVVEGCTMQKQGLSMTRPVVLDLNRPPTRDAVGMSVGEIAVVVDDPAGGDTEVVLRTADGEVRLEARSVVFEGDRSTTDPARAVIKLGGVDLASFAEVVGRLAVLAPSADIDAAVSAFVDAQSSLATDSDDVSNEVLPLVPIENGRGIDVNVRFRASSGLAVATVYVVWI
ncbi:MAG TPA: hypothetical protein PKA24_17405 [Microthrixaceae bacterium]|nr:hypothetical protein [Microthrixaceae bacterium]HMT62642.1 hypothetical protein [Microthrixaceae bacterium]